jgi:hypothetical protein
VLQNLSRFIVGSRQKNIFKGNVRIGQWNIEHLVLACLVVTDNS